VSLVVHGFLGCIAPAGARRRVCAQCVSENAAIPKTDKFLEVALSGKADLILTGDADLLTLNPCRGIAILSPAEYLKR